MENAKRQQLAAVATNIAAATAVAAAIGIGDPDAKVEGEDRRPGQQGPTVAPCKSDDGMNDGQDEQRSATAGGGRRPHQLLKVLALAPRPSPAPHPPAVARKPACAFFLQH
jgi:hypothetical protein